MVVKATRPEVSCIPPPNSHSGFSLWRPNRQPLRISYALFLDNNKLPHITIPTPCGSIAKMVFNGPINEAYPSPATAEQATNSHVQKGFKISVRKLPISKSGPIDEMSKKLDIPVPEMIFGDNMVSIEHIASGWRLEFNAFDALDRVDKTDKNMLKVAYSQEWTRSRFASPWYSKDTIDISQGEHT